jgi:hypothetical protein
MDSLKLYKQKLPPKTGKKHFFHLVDPFSLPLFCFGVCLTLMFAWSFNLFVLDTALCMTHGSSTSSTVGSLVSVTNDASTVSVSTQVQQTAAVTQQQVVVQRPTSGADLRRIVCREAQDWAAGYVPVRVAVAFKKFAWEHRYEATLIVFVAGVLARGAPIYRQLRNYNSLPLEQRMVDRHFSALLQRTLSYVRLQQVDSALESSGAVMSRSQFLGRESSLYPSFPTLRCVPSDQIDFLCQPSVPLLNVDNDIQNAHWRDGIFIRKLVFSIGTGTIAALIVFYANEDGEKTSAVQAIATPSTNLQASVANLEANRNALIDATRNNNRAVIAQPLLQNNEDNSVVNQHAARAAINTSPFVAKWPLPKQVGGNASALKNWNFKASDAPDSFGRPPVWNKWQAFDRRPFGSLNDED